MSLRPPGLALALLASLAVPATPGASAEEDKPTIPVHRASGPIKVDGDIGDAAWKDAATVETWYETNPGDNVAPKVRTQAWLTYDEKFFYVALRMDDPDPRRIRAPYGDHDTVNSSQDFAGVILDTRNDGKTAIELFANARGIQYDAVQDDSTGNEDSSPDLFWDSAGKMVDGGWTLEIRVPFSSLRYPRADPSTWGILIYRNYPREYRYQIFNARLPRGANCFICSEVKVTGLTGLPAGGHLTIAPYTSARRDSDRPDGGTGLEQGPAQGDLGGDLKWTPSANVALDATVNPDFSQVESDVAQISANQRFALFYPEKRPFFLEGVELFSTPVQAVYTRTVTDPQWGTRGTGRLGATSFTALVAQDEGGGTAIIPGSESSSFAEQDFRSWVGVGRVRHDFGKSFVSALVTDRELDGGGYNRVGGPDFQWRPSASTTLTGQLLWSASVTPNRPDLAEEWDGRHLAGHALDVWFSHSDPRKDFYTEARDLSEGFRADTGFVPQVGYRESNTEAGYTFRPQGFLRRVRTFTFFDYLEDADGLLSRTLSPGVGMDGRFNSFARVRYAYDTIRTGGVALPRHRVVLDLRAAPTPWLSNIELDGAVGQEIDFDNHRTGRGGSLTLYTTLRPTNRLELRLVNGRSQVSVPLPEGGYGRVFTARVDRVRATWTFSRRSFVRAIAQYRDTRRDPSLYLEPVDPRDGGFSTSLLFAYKLNWQTVLFVGWGNDEVRSVDTQQLQDLHRGVFVKLSYAFQR